MVSLFFWRKDKPAAAVAAAPTPSTAAAEATPTAGAAATPAPADESPEPIPAQRLALALALEDDRAADPSIRLDSVHTRLLLEASHEFARVGTEPRYTPQQPSLLPQLMEAINDEEASLRALSRIIAQDAQLTGELLRSANSPLYRVSPAPVESIDRATVLLGTSGLRSLIAGTLVNPLAQAGGHELGHFGERMWEQARYTASAAEAWAARTQSCDPFAAHLVALMYGLGCVTVYRVLMDLYGRQAVQPDAAAVANGIETSAAVTACRIAKSWGLSQRTSEALEAMSSAAPVADAAPLLDALRFGLLAGALTQLCRHGRITAGVAEEQLALAGYSGKVTDRIWERLVQAYIAHR